MSTTRSPGSTVHVEVDQNTLHGPVTWCRHVGLHLHGAQYDQGVSFLDLVPLLHTQTDHLTRHWGTYRALDTLLSLRACGQRL